MREKQVKIFCLNKKSTFFEKNTFFTSLLVKRVLKNQSLFNFGKSCIYTYV